MKKKLTGKTKAIMAAALALAVIVTIVGALSPATTPGQRIVQTLLSPFRSAVSAISRQAERYYNYVFRYEALEAENEELKKQIARMENEVLDAEELMRQNEFYRQALKLTEEHEGYYLCSAYIISWDTSNWKSAFTIGRGTRSGIEIGQVAITENGYVVGRVTDVGSNWATVTTVLDSSMAISATVSTNGYNGIVRGAYATGEEGLMRMDYLPTYSQPRTNDVVLTTGSTVYPRGLIIGYITDRVGFDETGVAKFAVLRPAADFDALKQILIITDYDNQ